MVKEIEEERLENATKAGSTKTDRNLNDVNKGGEGF
jgi:hypothetical protein